MANVEAKVNGKVINQIKPKRPAYTQLEKPYLEMIKYQRDKREEFYNNMDLDKLRRDNPSLNVRAIQILRGNISTKKAVCSVFGRVQTSLEKECDSGNQSYQNTCALKMSYAINEAKWSSLLRKDFQDTKGRPYILSVLGMINRLKSKFGNSDIEFGNNILKFQNDISGKKGIIVFLISGWSDANGHVTLWNGSLCVDGTNYFVPSEEYSITDLYFWELKD